MSEVTWLACRCECPCACRLAVETTWSMGGRSGSGGGMITAAVYHYDAIRDFFDDSRCELCSKQHHRIVFGQLKASPLVSCSSTALPRPARRSIWVASARAFPLMQRTKLLSLNKSLPPTPPPTTTTSPLPAQVSSLRAERESQRRSEHRYHNHHTPYTRTAAARHHYDMCVLLKPLLHPPSASKLAATWRAFDGRRSLRLNLEQRRGAHIDSFVAMPSPATLSSCVQSLNATRRFSLPLYAPVPGLKPTQCLS
jgi:hypothetical protein